MNIFSKLGLTIIYPIIYFPLIKPLDQLGGQKASFIGGLKQLWKRGNKKGKNSKDFQSGI